MKVVMIIILEMKVVMMICRYDCILVVMIVVILIMEDTYIYIEFTKVIVSNNNDIALI